ncbi:M56 family metallopeptidase [Fusibacillus kribbianus]|uniref:M56 family metallopeptidase n=1 Tax=Fusibacillus kribbianus TaxID=3044208 RepID=A0AAP4BDG0_9FIRM|nr:M56 family metallopeptidase [Ruminococcus sp. YH-rum2234]MDI9242329.1 M56 family metallopeptidase [Ruminococcus sp. YH-rum2234]
MSLSSSEWFFCILLTSITGSVAYGLWKVLELFLERYKKYNWLVFSAKLVVIFWLMPIVFLRFKCASYNGQGGVNDIFGISPFTYRVLKIVFFIWLLGFLCQCTWHFKNKQYLKYIKKHNILPEQELVDVKNMLQEQYGIKRRVEIYKNIICTIPQVSGIRKPVILLPENIDISQNTEIIIGHELMHVKHRDQIWLYFLVWLKRIHWFNPIVYLLTNDIVEWNEIYCDRDLCKKENAPFSYQQYFKAIANFSGKEKRNRMGLTMSALFENMNSVKRRVLKLKGYQYMKELKKSTVLLLSVLFVGTVTVTSYAASDGVLQGYDFLKEQTEVVIEEELEEPEVLIEEIIPAETESKITEIEMPLIVTRGTSSYTWTIPVNTLKKTIEFTPCIGDEILVMASIEPSDCLTRVGLMEPDGVRRAVSSTGKIDHTFTIRKSGGHRVYIENQSNQTISVSFVLKKP